MSEKQELFVNELLNDVYATLAERHNGEELSFPRTIKNNIAYKRAGTMQIGDDAWTLVKGNGVTETRQYICDSILLAIPPEAGGNLTGRTEAERGDVIREAPQTLCNVLFGFPSGVAGIHEASIFRDHVYPFLDAESGKYVSQEARHDGSIDMTYGTEVFSQPIKYTTDFVTPLADCIEDALRSYRHG